MGAAACSQTTSRAVTIAPSGSARLSGAAIGTAAASPCASPGQDSRAPCQASIAAASIGPAASSGSAADSAVLDQQERHAGCRQGEHRGAFRQLRQEVTRPDAPCVVDDRRVEP